MQLNRSLLRFSCRLFLPLSGVAAAIGLGELRGQPALGERPRLEIDILGAGKESLDASCFRLVQPVGATDLPWLKKLVSAFVWRRRLCWKFAQKLR